MDNNDTSGVSRGPGDTSSDSGGSSSSSSSGARGRSSTGRFTSGNRNDQLLYPWGPYREYYGDSVETPMNLRESPNRNDQRFFEEGQGQSGKNPINLIVVPGKTEGDPNTQMNTCNHPTVLPIPVGGAFGGYGYGAPAVAPAVAPAYGGLSNDFYSYNAALMASENACRAVEATKESESDVKDAIMNSNTQRMTADLNLHNRLCDSEKAAITAGFEARLESKETKADLLARIEECCCDMKVMNLENKQFVTEKFCDVDKQFASLDRRIDKQFDEIRTREDKREIAQLREALTECRVTGNNAALASSIVSALQCAGIVAPATAAATTHAH